MTRPGVLLAVAAAVALTTASLTAVAVADPGGRPSNGLGPAMMMGARATSCQLPASLPARQVTVMLADMPGGMMAGRMMTGPAMGGSMMTGSMMGGRWSAGTGATGAPGTRPAVMMLRAMPATVPTGRISLLAVNHGTRTHELVVLPLSAGASVGARGVGADGTVSESGGLGEASKTCGAGAGDGITAGTAGWVTVRLPAGRYELVCNLPGHYAAGMYAELDVT